MDHEALAYLLGDKYEDISLSHARLIGRDLLVVAQLKEACDVSGFCVYLAKLEKTVYGYSDWQEVEHAEKNYMEGVHDPSVELSQIVDLNGTELFKGLEIPFDEERIVQACPFDDQEPDDEDYDDDDGNITHYYHQSVCVPHLH
jgi:hypothetical protein